MNKFLKNRVDNVREDFLKLKNLLIEAQEDHTNDPDEFLRSKIFKMGRFIRVYSEFLNNLSVITDSEAKKTLEIIDQDSEDLETTLANELESFKIEWNTFLNYIELNVI